MIRNFLTLAVPAVGAFVVPRQHFNSHTTQHFNWSDTKHLIAFGDSYTYVQGKLGHSNASFIGSAANLSYTPAQLLSNPIVQNQTATAEGGPNWVEYLTKCGLNTGSTLPQSCEFQLWDFAFSGADVSNIYTPSRDWTVSLWNQTESFLKYAQPTLKDDKFNVDLSALYESMIGTLFEQMQKVHDSAGYKNFLFLNLPPIDRTHDNLIRLAGPLPNKTMIDRWDDTLANHSSTFETRNQGVKSMIFDANSFLNGVLDNHKAYNISNTTSYCVSYNQPLILKNPAHYGCLPQNEYFWYNNLHLTSHVHSILASEVDTFLKSQSGRK